MNWMKRITRREFYKWLSMLILVLLLTGILDKIGFIGAVPSNWYFSTLMNLLATGLLFTAGIHLCKLHGNRKLMLACFILGAILLLGSIHWVIAIIQMNIDPNYSFYRFPFVVQNVQRL